jgi:hypothetical protein
MLRKAGATRLREMSPHPINPHRSLFAPINAINFYLDN